MIYRDLVDYLGIQGIPGQIGITTITNSGKAVEPNRISFTLNSEESFGESIEVSEAYVLPDLNQSQRGLPQQIDVCNHFHLCDIEFPAVNIMRVPILEGNNIPYAHIQKVQVSEDARKGLYRYPLGWYVCGCCGARNPQGVSVSFVSVDHKQTDRQTVFILAR